jgi:hypothetical protein
MLSNSTSELTLIEKATAPSQPVQHNPRQTRAAIKRCCAAWQRAYDEYLKNPECEEGDEVFATHDANSAYCEAMPTLGDYQKIRDFIACAAHGILVDAIPQNRANQILYAAQVALAALQSEPKPRKSA